MSIIQRVPAVVWAATAAVCILAASYGGNRIAQEIRQASAEKQATSCPTVPPPVPLPASPYPSRLMSVTPDGTALYVLYLKNGAVYFTNKGHLAQFQANQ